MKLYYVYILKCADNSYYAGVTNNLDRRLDEHNSGIIKGYTSKRLPVNLVYVGEFNDIREAIAFEKQIKRWRREKKEALVRNDYDLLSELARSYSSMTSHGSTSSP